MAIKVLRMLVIQNNIKMLDTLSKAGSICGKRNRDYVVVKKPLSDSNTPLNGGAIT